MLPTYDLLRMQREMLKCCARLTTSAARKEMHLNEALICMFRLMTCNFQNFKYKATLSYKICLLLNPERQITEIVNSPPHQVFLFFPFDKMEHSSSLFWNERITKEMPLKICIMIKLPSIVLTLFLEDMKI